MNRTRTSKNAKRLLVWLLLLTMVFGLLPMAAFADEAGEPALEVTEPTSEPEQPEPEQPGNAVVTIEGDEEQPEDDADAEDEITTLSTDTLENFKYSIVMVDCGRKYYSVENINAIIDSASAAGMHYVMLAVGNNGMRFLLDDMSLTVGNKTYTHDEVSKAIHNGNLKYDADTSKTKGQVYDPYTRGDTTDKDVEELTQNDMNAIMRNANDKGVQIIPLINTPGHMDAILSAASSLTGKNCSYSGSVRTIDVTNATAVAFTHALLQKYIVYFAGKDCKFFNMGADEYANDKFTGGSMGFGNLQSEGNYSYYVQYVNQVAAYIKNAGMTPMAFNDGIYFNSNTSSGKFDTDILICYWSSGWDGYSPMPASTLKSKGFSLVNTHGDYYWVLGKSDAQCSPAKAAGFDETVFPGSTINEPSGAMFCIWCDYPGKDTAENVVNKTAATIDAFGKALPNPPTTGGSTGGGSTGGETQEPVPVNLTVGETSDPYYQDGDYSSVKNTDDDTIATVVTSVGDKPGKTTYESTKIGEGTFWISTSPSTTTAPSVKLTFESVGNNECYVKNAGGQYIYPYYYSSFGYKTAYLGTSRSPVKLTVTPNGAGYYDFSYGTAYLAYENSSIGAATGSGDSTHLYLLEEKTTPAEKQTTITFTGVKPGTTTCQIGNTKYTITVTEEDLTKVTPLTLEYWITNSLVKDSSTGKTTTEVSALTDGIATSGGVDASSLVATPGNRDGRDVFYWQCRLLDKAKTNSSTSGTEQQTVKNGDDETSSGVGFTKIRYYNGAWAVYTENFEWVAVGSTHQLVAYTGTELFAVLGFKIFLGGNQHIGTGI